MKDVLLKLLDWPFLLFGSLVFLVLFFRQHVERLLNRGDIHISWGEGKSIRLLDLSDSIDKELIPIREKVDMLEMKLNEMQGATASPGNGTSVGGDLSAEDRELALANMLQALNSKRWSWRTLDRLALAGRISANEARQLLLDQSEVVFSQNKEGQTLVKLRDG